MVWGTQKLGVICEKIGSGSTPRGGASVYVESGTALIRSQNIYNSFFTKNGLVCLTDDTANRMRNVSVHENDVLLNITGDSVARSCIIPPDVLPARVNQHVAILRTIDTKLNAHFLAHYLVSPKMQATMLSLAGSGGTRKALTKEMIEDFDIPLPELPTQKRIAQVLSAYDDMIENNRRRIVLLEEAARLIYREWFVQFRFPNYENVKFKNGLPLGWELKKVADLGQIITGKTPSKKDAENFGGHIPFIKTPDMHDNIFVLETSETLTDKGAQTQRKKTLPPHSVVVACIGTVGVVSLVAEQSQFNQQINAVICKEWISPFFAYFCLKSLKPSLEAIGGGSTMANVNKTKFQSVNIVLPSPKIVAEYHDIASPIFQQIKNLSIEIQALTTARNLLLPRLMDGRITV